MNNKLISEFSLPKYIKDKSFAEASKLIENKFKDRNDKVAIETKEELLSRLASAQEFVKQKENLQTPDTNQHMIGAMVTAANAAGAAGSGMAGAGLLAGGSIFPPLLAAGALPLAYKALTAHDRKQEAYERQSEALQGQYADLRSDFAMGGQTNDYVAGALVAALPSILGTTGALAAGAGAGTAAAGLSSLAAMGAAGAGAATGAGTAGATAASGSGSLLGKIGSFLKSDKGQNTLNQALRYSPVISNLLQSSKLQQPNTPRGNRVAAQYDKQMFDTNQLVNLVNQNNVSGALSEASGGDLGALRTNILAGNLNKNKAIADAVLKGDQVNRGEEQFQFNNILRRDMFNTQLDERFLERKAQDIGAYNSAKSAFASANAEALGAIGKEGLQRKQLERMFGYDWLGRYLNQNQKAYGGKVKKKRK